MNKKILSLKLMNILPLEKNMKYYIIESKYNFESTILKPYDLDFKEDPFPEVSIKNFDKVLKTNYHNLFIYQCDGLGKSTDKVNLGELFNLKNDKSDFVKVTIKHVFDCVPFNTTTYHSFVCSSEDIENEIKTYKMKMIAKFDLHYEEPSIILERKIEKI